MKRLAAVLVTTTLMFAAASQAAVVEPLGLRELAERSSLVLRGQVLESRAVHDRNRGRVTTVHRIKILESYRGGAEAGGEVRVVTLGGETAELGQVVPGEARLKPGEEVVLFLRGDKNGYSVAGMALGKFRVVRGDGPARLERDLQHLGFVRSPAPGQVPATLELKGFPDRLQKKDVAP